MQIADYSEIRREIVSTLWAVQALLKQIQTFVENEDKRRETK